MKYTKEQFLKSAELGEVSMIDAKHIVSLLDEVIELPQQETLYTEEQVREAIGMARNMSGYVTYEYTENEIIQSLKQPKQ
jgi:hypothetical protein